MPLLTTKLYIPPLRSELVIRSRLVERLDRGLSRTPGVTLISAPTGFGKSTLVVEWLRQLDRPVGWLSLDEADNDPVRFLTYFVAACRQISVDIGQTAENILQAQGSQASAPELLLTTLINDFSLTFTSASGPTQSAILVLDDYHMITNGAIHNLLTFLLDHLPHPLHLLITSRVDPPLTLARLRARGQLTELREADLRFTSGEVITFLHQVMNLQLSPEEIAALETRTEGWIAGLQLAALSMQGMTDHSGFIHTFTGSHRYIMDYLVEEVLHRQPEEIQQFLLQTSLLERLSGPLCDAVLGQGEHPTTSGQKLLEQLETANLFIIPLDSERRWYRYHHLFADLLRFRLQQIRPAEQVAHLHRRAADWFEANGAINEAVSHTITAGDTEQLVRLITTHARSKLIQGELGALQSWLDALPVETLHARPELCLIQAWLLFIRRRLQAVESFLQAAEQVVETVDPAIRNALQGEILTIRAFVTGEQGHFDQAANLARQALIMLPENNLFVRSSSALALGHALYSLGHTAAAVTALAESVALCRAARNAIGALHSLGEWIVLLTLQGQLRQADQILHQAFQWTAGHNWQQLPPAAILYVRLGDIRREQNNLPAAEQLLNQAIQLAQFGAPIIAARAHAFLARVKQVQGDHPAAEAAWQKVAQLSHGWESGQELAYFAAYQTRLNLFRGDLIAAAAWAGRIPPWTPAETPDYSREFELVTLARVRLGQGLAQPNDPHLAGSITLLNWLRTNAEEAGRIGIVLETLVLEAMVRTAHTDTAEALALLKQALALAEPEGYVRIFLDEGPSLARLLAQLPSTPYQDRLLAAFKELEEQKSQGTPIRVPAKEQLIPSAPQPPRTPALVEPLSDRELEVLRLMAEGYSNREIAEKLIFTVATAKKHAENIYSKLGVHSRTQALARARELNLL
jgi:LuxR family maltose regulon positive regulatory protein